MTRRIPYVLSFLAALLTLAPSVVQAQAQAGSIAGQVRDEASGQPLSEARVIIISQDRAILGESLTGVDGRFRIVNVQAGTHTVVVRKLGFGEQVQGDVRISTGETANVTISLDKARTVELDPVVVTGSRVAERAIESVQRIDVVPTVDIENRPTPTKAGHLVGRPGVDVAPMGLQSEIVTTRGWGNIFSGSLMMMSDHRIAGVPSLRVNLMHMIPSTNDDLERIEVMLGPGSAVYGPNTANGVLHFLSKSPLTSQGTTVSLTGGGRDLVSGTLRTAQRLSDNLGVKVSGEYMRAQDWPHVDPVEAAAGVTRDLGLERWSGEMRADWRVSEDVTSVFSVGRSHLANGVELTGIGAAQVRDWAYTYYQARAQRGALFGQLYLNTSDAGQTFLLRTGEPIFDESRLLVAQLQHGTTWGARHQFVYGVDYLHTQPNTGGTIHGRYEDDDDVREIGAFLQSRTRLSSVLELVAAGRIDDHNRLEQPVFSPRAALVLMPTNTQAFRFTYNRAFSTPRSLDFFLDIDAGPFPNDQLRALGYGLRAQGAGGTGFAWQQANGSYVMRSPLAPLGTAQAGRTDVIAANVPTMWDIGIGFLQDQNAFGPRGSAQALGTAALLRSLSPQDADIVRLTWDVLSGQRAPLANGVDDIPVLRPSYTTTWELGYQGILGGRLRLGADLWTSTRTNFVSALRPVSPLLQLDSASTHAFLAARGFSAAQAAGIAGGMSRVPIGVLTTPDVSTAQNRSDFLVTYRNFGRLSLWGSDLSAEVHLTDVWRLMASGSFTNRDIFITEGELLTLNAPARKLSTGVAYMPEQGLHGDLRVRYNAAFPVLSAPYTATACIADEDLPTGWQRSSLEEPCVESSTLGDVTVGYRFTRLRGTGVQFSVQNIFDTGYRSFPGASQMRRLAFARVRYEF